MNDRARKGLLILAVIIASLAIIMKLLGEGLITFEGLVILTISIYILRRDRNEF